MSDEYIGPAVRKAAIALFLCIALVVFCYFFVDRPVAFFVHSHKISSYLGLKWLTLPPPIVQEWTPLVLVVVVLLRLRGPLRPLARTMLLACVAMVVADQFRESISLVFGRDWPETWIDNNPSLIRDGAYGFHWFQGNAVDGSFPSGHMARTLAVAAVVWMSDPRWRWVCILCSAAVAVGLLGMNYHFVSDVIAGSFVGGIVGTFAVLLSGWRAGTDRR